MVVAVSEHCRIGMWYIFNWPALEAYGVLIRPVVAVLGRGLNHLE